MNRNLLKIIAFISMVVDHVGDFLLKGNIACKIIGRIAFPIFAFFIAEGMKFTKSRKCYFVKLLIFAFVSQIPYILLLKTFKLNILFTFLIAISLIIIIERFFLNKHKNLCVAILSLCLILCDVFPFVDYGTLGVVLVLIFYFLKSPTKFIVSTIVMLLILLRYSLWGAENVFALFIAIYSILPIIMLLLYNNCKEKLNLKYLFYVGYPVHLILIWIISLFI